MTRQDCLNKILLLSDQQLEELVNSWENTVIKRQEGGPIIGDPTRSMPEQPIGVQNIMKYDPDGQKLLEYVNKISEELDKDKDYLEFVNTLPENQRLTPLTDYDMYLYWKLNGKPKDFEKAKEKGMFNFNKADNKWHANSVQEDSDGNVYFMKPKSHDTVFMETNWYTRGMFYDDKGNPRPGTDEEIQKLYDFRRKYDLIDDPDRPGFWMYKRKKDNESVEKKQQGGVLNLEEELQKILPTDEYLKLTIKNYSEFNKL